MAIQNPGSGEFSSRRTQIEMTIQAWRLLQAFEVPVRDAPRKSAHEKNPSWAA
jgi:hypothetical protein